MSDDILELEIQPPYIGSAYAPQVEVSETSGGHNVAITYDDAESGITTVDFDVLDGEQGPQGETGAAAGFGAVSASVDDEVGTPSVTVTSSGPDTAKEFDFAFHNMKGETGDAAGFGAVSASVDANVGTPSVTVTSGGPDTAKTLDFAFKNLKGNKGDTGDAAGFGSPTASVDENVGTPSVAVTASGPNTAKVFDFAFRNLKGQTGAAAGFGTVSATVDNATGTPSVEVTASGKDTAKNFAFAFHNLKGPQGEPGDVQSDGHYPLLGAGVADALSSSYGETDTFARRASTRSGAVEIQSILGNTIVENDELVSVNIEGVKVVGFNQWDEEWEVGAINVNTGQPGTAITTQIRSKNFIPVIPNTTYYVKASTETNQGVYVLEYDGSKAYLNLYAYKQNATVTLGSSTKYIKIYTLTQYGNVYKHDICINISNPSLNGTYRPYVEHTREIPASTYFPNGMRSAGTAHDELANDKAITRIGSRAYQSGDESDTSVITDGTTTYYALSAPVVVEIDPPLNLTYPVEQGGTESIIVPTGSTSAAPTFVTLYAYDADGIIDKTQSIIAQVESGTASTNYAAGSYLVMRSVLYRVTSAIATGETITPGTNCTATTVMAEIVRLTA